MTRRTGGVGEGAQLTFFLFLGGFGGADFEEFRVRGMNGAGFA